MTKRERLSQETEIEMAERIIERRSRGLRGGHELKIAQERFGKEQFAATMQRVDRANMKFNAVRFYCLNPNGTRSFTYSMYDHGRSFAEQAEFFENYANNLADKLGDNALLILDEGRGVRMVW